MFSIQGALAQGFIPAMGEQPRDQAVMTGLLKTATEPPTKDKNGEEAQLQFSMAGIRGGSGSKHPLGQYLVEPNFEFRSEYKNESTQTMCEFAYDLHQFVASKGRTYEDMRRDTNLDYVPYEKQAEFARSWWRRKNKKYDHMGGLFKDWFINDALIDGTNLYNYWYRDGHSCADYIIWGDAALQSLVKRKP
jgi:hypothetical protein